MLTSFALHATPSDPPPVEAFEAAAALRSRLADAQMAAAALDLAISATDARAPTVRIEALRRLAVHLSHATDHIEDLAKLLDATPRVAA
jgi:hypothetical protein